MGGSVRRGECARDGPVPGVDAPDSALCHPGRPASFRVGLVLTRAPNGPRAPVNAQGSTDRKIRGNRSGLPTGRLLNACTKLARSTGWKWRCGVGPEISPGVAKGDAVPARTQDGPRRSSSAGRAGTGTRRRTVSRPTRACRAPIRHRRREALQALARRRSLRGSKAEGCSSFQSDTRVS